MSIISSFKNNIFLRNTMFNYIGMIWMGGGIIVLIPFYIKLLGPHGWGIVSACLSIQAMLLILDAGCSQIMPRDIAKTNTPENIFFAYFWIYIAVAFVGAVFLTSSAGWLAFRWFNAGHSSRELEFCIRLLAIQFLFQFANNLNIGFWNGAQKQFNTNLSQVCFFSCKHCVALISLMVNPEPIVYIVSFAVVTCIEFIFNFLWITRNNIDLKGLIDNNILIQLIDLVKENYIFSFGVIVGVFVSQLDKILLSHYVETQLYGVYVIVAQLGLSFLQLQYPLMKSLLPALSSQGEKSIFNVLSLKKMIIMLLVLAFPIGLTIIFSSDILYLWTRNHYIANHGGGALALICLSVLINIPYTFIYTNLVRLNAGGIILFSNIISALSMFILFHFMKGNNSISIGGMMWIAYASISFSIGGIFLLMRAR